MNRGVSPRFRKHSLIGTQQLRTEIDCACSLHRILRHLHSDPSHNWERTGANGEAIPAQDHRDSGEHISYSNSAAHRKPSYSSRSKYDR
jgi:hypothetical protein